MKTILQYLAIVMLAAGLLSISVAANPVAEVPPAVASIKRDILAIYDGNEEKGPDETRIHKFLEMPLNHLGYRITYWDWKRGRPPADLTLQHSAVVTWFADKIPNGDAYFDWATWAARMKVRFVLFGAVGLEGGTSEVAKVNRLYNELGLEFISHYVSATSDTKVVTKDSTIVEFEYKLPKPVPGYLVIRAKDPSVQTLLSMRDPELKSFGPEPVLIASTSSRGGYLAANYAINYDSKSNRLSWFIDPIAFLSKALSTGLAPVADTTTRAGRRMYLSHIDGDGWNNTSDRIPLVNGVAPLAAETVLDRLIAPFPDLPVSIGLISCDIDEALPSTPRAVDVARKLYALPQVEVASHTHSHPYDWSFFEKYSRARELERISPPTPRITRPLVAKTGQKQDDVFDLFGGAKPLAVRAPSRVVTAYASGGPLPRYKADKPFDLRSEVAGSLNAASALAPEGKRAKLYLWSGNTRPFAAAVRATRQAGVRNMNGGDTRYDREFASLAYVRPLSRVVGRERQIFTPNSNEMIYTNEWKGPYNGFEKLRDTFERTDAPRRLKPANVYYHMFSADQPAGLEAVRSHLMWARNQPLIPVAASRYAAIADDFFEVEFQPLELQAWRVLKRGELQTVRFDSAADRVPDYAKSVGVLGHNHHNGALYVALDPAVSEPVIAVQPKGAKSRAHLIESRWDVRDLAVAECSVRFKAEGFGNGDMRWAGLKPGAWTIKISRDGHGVSETSAPVDAAGNLTTRFETDARAGAAIEMRCAG